MSREPRCISVPKDPGTEWEGPRGGRAVGWEGVCLEACQKPARPWKPRCPGQPRGWLKSEEA